MTDAPLPLNLIAARILKHLQRIEDDPKLNRKKRSGLTPLYFVNAWQGGGRVRVRYVVFQDPCSLTRSRALAYLAWLDAGNTGTHFDFIRSNKESTNGRESC